MLLVAASLPAGAIPDLAESETMTAMTAWIP
jgi:hypothetical protein